MKIRVHQTNGYQKNHLTQDDVSSTCTSLFLHSWYCVSLPTCLWNFTVKLCNSSYVQGDWLWSSWVPIRQAIYLSLNSRFHTNSTYIVSGYQLIVLLILTDLINLFVLQLRKYCCQDRKGARYRMDQGCMHGSSSNGLMPQVRKIGPLTIIRLAYLTLSAPKLCSSHLRCNRPTWNSCLANKIHSQYVHLSGYKISWSYSSDIPVLMYNFHLAISWRLCEPTLNYSIDFTVQRLRNFWLFKFYLLS